MPFEKKKKTRLTKSLQRMTNKFRQMTENNKHKADK